MIAFLRWWLIFWLSVVGLALAGLQGFYQYLWKSDATYLSWFTLGVYVLMTSFIGQLTRQSRSGDQEFVRHLPFCWYVAKQMLSIGMMGTIIGFLFLLRSLKGVGTGDVQAVIGVMSVGFSTAGLTTVVGLACSGLLGLQLINLQYLLRDD